MFESLGPHAAFIIASYGVVGFVLSALIAWLYLDGRAQKRQLDDLEARGIRRGSRTRHA